MADQNTIASATALVVSLANVVVALIGVDRLKDRVSVLERAMAAQVEESAEMSRRLDKRKVEQVVPALPAATSAPSFEDQRELRDIRESLRALQAAIDEAKRGRDLLTEKLTALSGRLEEQIMAFRAHVKEYNDGWQNLRERLGEIRAKLDVIFAETRGRGR
jgi:chromosome segregation ATPase